MESRPDGRGGKENRNKTQKKRKKKDDFNLLHPFQNVLQTFFFFFFFFLFFRTPLYFSFILLVFLPGRRGKKGRKKQRRVIESGDTRDAYNLDGGPGIPNNSLPPQPPLSFFFPHIETKGFCPHAHARATDTFFGGGGGEEEKKNVSL